MLRRDSEGHGLAYNPLIKAQSEFLGFCSLAGDGAGVGAGGGGVGGLDRESRPSPLGLGKEGGL